MTSRRKTSGWYYSGKNPIFNVNQSEIIEGNKEKRDENVEDPTHGKFMRLNVESSSYWVSGVYKARKTVIDPPKILWQENKYKSNIHNIPFHGKKTNILFHPIPSIELEPMFEAFEKSTSIICITIVISIIVFGKLAGGALHGLILISLCITSVIFLWMKDLVQKSRLCQWQGESKRGEYATANMIPESVEWINSFLGKVWGLVDPEKLSSVAELLENVMQASAPSIIENVRVAEINQGSNPLRILSLQALPESQVKEFKCNVRSQISKDKSTEETKFNEDDGAFFNLECSFAYHAKRSPDDAPVKIKNMHMQLFFDIGIKGLFGVPFPVFVELQELVGKMRLRLRISSEPPLLKELTFTLISLPQVQVSCTPMIQAGINILNLPIISRFINESIVTVISEYIAPKSGTLDLGRILQGDDIQKEVKTMGMLWIKIHKVIGLGKQDRRGSDRGGSDSYITVGFSKYGKPMYSTRVIQDDLNPIWEESCALLINPALIKVDEQLSIELWDYDRSTPDNLLGRIELSLQKMIKHSGKMFNLISRLQSSNRENLMSGELFWEIGYFRKSNLNLSLRTDGIDKNLPDGLKDIKELHDEKGKLNNTTEEAVAHTPPDPLWSSGICSIIIHKIVNLELQNMKGNNGKRKGREYEPALKSGDLELEENKDLASSYCTILINDELVYRTRTKNVCGTPIFNTGTNRFIRDWRSAIITITVRDQRMREHDPILGVISLKISTLLQKSSQVTRWYPLTGGIGYGHIRVSLLFRSFEILLPPQQLGWDVGTFEITSTILLASGYEKISKLKMRTGGSSGSVPRSRCQKSEIEDGVFWDISKTDGKNFVRLPVKYRYRSPIVFEFHVTKKVKPDAYAIIWLHNIEDNVEMEINIPIWKTDNGTRLTQNYITKENCQNISDLHVEEIGQLAFTARFKSGIDHDHRKFVADNESRETQETWEACFSDDLRKSDIKQDDLYNISNLNRLNVSQTRNPHLRSYYEEAKIRKQLGNYAIYNTRVGSDCRIKNDRIPSPSEGISYISGSSSDYHSDDEDLDLSGSGSDTLSFHDAPNYGQPKSEDICNQARQDFHSRNPLKQISKYNEDKDNLHRKHRGLMQWKPIRNLGFAKDETKFLLRRTLRKSSLQER
ncbi:hypothetical protein EPUL_003642, partial [Erysiphe pulchra]